MGPGTYWTCGFKLNSGKLKKNREVGPQYLITRGIGSECELSAAQGDQLAESHSALVSRQSGRAGISRH